MPAYYNEIDPYAAQWLRNLIAAGHIAPGDVDERDIRDVRPDDLRGYQQCHFFAGVGVWSHSLRRAGWGDDRPVWSGSCPCQPFSQAGSGLAFADERHLWPHFFHLISECRPAVVLGEQVASKDADPWIDLVHADLEAMGYAFGAVPFPSAGVGAPHIRDRLYWVANTESSGRREEHADLAGCASRDRSQGIAAGSLHGRSSSGMVDSDGRHTSAQRKFCGGELGFHPQNRGGARSSDKGAWTAVAGGLDPAPTNGFWRDSEWIFCRDGRWRPVEPFTRPLVNGTPARMGRGRAYGNAINAEAARVWIETVMECLPSWPSQLSRIIQKR